MYFEYKFTEKSIRVKEKIFSPANKGIILSLDVEKKYLTKNIVKKNVILYVVCLSFLLTTCAKDVYNPDVCFNKNVLPIFISNCTMSGCHNSTDHEAGYDLSNYDGIMQGVKTKYPLFSEVYNSIKGNKPSMPPRSYPKLKALDVTYIKIWIDMGADNSSNCGGGCDTSNFSYTGRINPIMQTWCVGCHNPSNAGSGISLSDYTGISSTKAISRMLGSLKHLQGYYAMPQSGNPLSSCDINIIEKWINNGYPNN